MSKKLNCVMLIDDNDDDNFYHEIILRETGITSEIKVADTAYKALDILQKGHATPDLIFLDINMPRMNGWEFLERYHHLNEKQKAKTVIIMLTTSLNPADKKRAHSIPEISGFETKPLTAEMVTKIIDKFFKTK